MKVITKEELSVGDIKEDLLEKKPLPMGMTEFNEWSDRIIKAAGVGASERSLKHSLAAMIMHLAPTEAFKEDGYFVLSLRKAAVNQVAYSVMEEYQKEIKAEREKAEATAPALRAVDGLLENKDV